MKLHTLQATHRETGRKGLITQTRKMGNIPAVVYGGEQGAFPVSVNRRDLERIFHTEGGTHALIQLDFTDMPQHNTPAIVKSIQYHPVTDSVLHVDFQRIRLDERIQSPVAVVLTGRPKGVVEGGVLEHQLREITVECFALDLPEHIEIDVSNLGMGESIHVSDVTPSEGITIITDPELTIASIHAPRVMKAAEAALEEAEAEKESESGEE